MTKPYMEGEVYIVRATWTARVLLGVSIVTFPLWFPFWLLGTGAFRLLDWAESRYDE